jgi:hypothetical protein
MCFLCEEPFRSVFIALAAIGAVSIVRLLQKGVKRLRSAGTAEAAASGSPK